MFTRSEIILIIEVIILALLFIPTVMALLIAPWVPTPEKRILKMLELANIKPGDKVYDLGCGDGRMVHLASKVYGANSVGVEFSPLVYAMARVRNFILSSKSKVIFADFRKVDLSDAKVVMMYLLPQAVEDLRPKFERELPHGAKIISYAFAIKSLEPTYVEPKNPERNHAPIWIYEIQNGAQKLKDAPGIPANK